MTININCIYNDNFHWCTNEKVKKSFFGIGPRHCPLSDPKKTCELQTKHECKNLRPPPPQRPPKK